MSNKKFILWVLLGIGINLYLISYIVYNYSEIEQLKEKNTNIIKASNQFIIHFQEMESAQRGYLLTKEEAYLDNYPLAHENALISLALIELMAKENQLLSKRVNRLKLYFRISFNRMQNTIESAKRGDFKYAKYVIIQDFGMQHSSKLKKIIYKFINNVNKQLDIQKEQYKQMIKIIFILIVLELILGIVFIYLFYRKRRKLENAKRELEHYFQIIDKHTLFTRSDMEGNIRYVSEAFCELSGYKKEELIGKSYNILRDSETPREVYKELWDRISKNMTWFGEMKDIKKDGSTFWLMTEIKPDFDKNNKKIGYVSFSQNISDKKELEEQEKHLLESSKMVAVGEMIANIAHQWRQPLSLISVISTGIILKKEHKIVEVSDEQLIKDLEKVNNYAQDLSETINTFNDFLENDQEEKEVIIQERIDAALHIITASLENSQIKLINNIDYEDKIRLKIVFGQLPQVIINIINNAREALIKNNIKNGWIKINLKRKDNFVQITIADNAGGIPSDIMNKVFEPYFTTKHQSQGTGLGLHLCYKIVVGKLKGKIYFKNNRHGAKFFIELPMKN